MAGCPVMRSMPSELTDTLATFNTLIPICKAEEETLRDCRSRQAVPSYWQSMQASIFGPQSCTAAAQRLTACIQHREKQQHEILEQCSGGHRALAKRYNTCLAEHDGDAAACRPVLEEFLKCGRDMALAKQPSDTA